MFHVQVEIGLYIMSPTLESFSRPFMRLWFYAAFIQIEFESSVRSYLVAKEEKVAFYLLTYGFNKKRKNRKERSIRSINPFKLIKRVKVLGSAKRENKFPPLGFCQDIFVCCLHPYTKQNNKIFIQTFRCAVFSM